MSVKSVKGVVLIEDESGARKRLTKYTYLQMVKAGRKVKLIAEALTAKELDEIMEKRGEESESGRYS